MSRYRGNWETGERRFFRRVLVVGAGRAGVAAAEELRRQGFGGEIVVMCDEPEAPYDRPSCSKGILNGTKRPKDARMPVQEDLAIQWEMGRRAVHLDPVNRVVMTDTDESYRYDGLVIATGARPLWPKGWPTGEPGLHQVHGLADAWRLRQALHRARRVAIVGGGLTGCEVACTVRSLARECVLIDSKQQVMSRALGEVAGRYITEEVARDGVELRLGRRVRGVDRGRKGWVLTLDDGSEVTADLVVATIGERPDTEWLASTGFDISDGVLCDEHLRVVGGEDVVACGTVARWPNLRYSTEPRRVGQWIMALEQGRAAAATLLRSDHPTRPAALVPRYWSEQFGLRIQVCGEVPQDGSAEMTVTRQRPGRRDTARGGVLINYYRDGEQIGVVGINAVRAFTTTARMMLATPPRLREPEPEPVYFGPRMLTAAPAPAPTSPPPVGPAPVSPAPRRRYVIDAPPDAVSDHGYQPVSGGGAYRPAHAEGRSPRHRYEPAGEGLGYDPRENGRSAYSPGYARSGYAPGGYDPSGHDAPAEPVGYGPGGSAGYESPYGSTGYGSTSYQPAGYGLSGYSPDDASPGYEPPGYPRSGYGAAGGRRSRRAARDEPAYESRSGYEPRGFGYESPDYRTGRNGYEPPLERDPEDGFGSLDESAPVSPARPRVSGPPRLSPRDRFATGQFAAVR